MQLALDECVNIPRRQNRPNSAHRTSRHQGIYLTWLDEEELELDPELRLRLLRLLPLPLPLPELEEEDERPRRLFLLRLRDLDRLLDLN